MTLRIDLSKKMATSLDGAVKHDKDVIKFKDLSELPPLVVERVALLRLTQCNDIVDYIGVKMAEDIYYVCEL